ncbi:MAG: C2H2-type zinc finger protein [Candidatus Thiodiazotropha sp.]
MANTKKTKRKDPKCPMCPFKTSDPEAMRAHLVVCGLRKMEKRFKCDECSYETDKSSNLMRHKDRLHSRVQKMKEQMESTVGQEKDELQESESDKEDWEKSDPGDLSDIIGEAKELSDSESSTGDKEDGKYKPDEISTPDPTVRVPTEPKPVFTPKKTLSVNNSASLRDRLKRKWRLAPFKVPRIQRPVIKHSGGKNLPAATATSLLPQTEASMNKIPPTVPKQSGEKISRGVQTEPLRNRKVVWKTTKYQVGDKDIEIVEMEETEYTDF